MEEQDAYISTTEAAIRLGISEDAVRKRIKIGSLSGKKVGKKWLVSLESLQKPSRNGHAADTDLLIQQLREDVSFLKEQLVATNHQLSEKDEQLRALLADLEGWREQVRYKELQLAQAQDRLLELPHLDVESVDTSPPDGSEQHRNPLSWFWHWFIGK
jgi:excisionase family DNA binding protein